MYVENSGKIKRAIQKNDFTETLIILTCIFFIWGFITSMNGILLPKLEVVFKLDRFDTILVQSAFFGAYFVISGLYFIISNRFKDPILHFGLKNIIILGIVISGIGCFLFYPAAQLKLYNIFITALFILAAGITILQIAANPYVTHLGNKKNDASRLILSQAFNSLGTTLAPFTGLLIFNNIQSFDSADTVKLPYVGLAAALFLLSLLLTNTSFTSVIKNNAEDLNIDTHISNNKHVILGLIAIFMYVGGEVSISSYIVPLIQLKDIGNVMDKDTGQYLSLYWGGAMVGRFTGALFLSKMNRKTRSNTTLILIILIIPISFLVTNNALISFLIIFLFLTQIFGYFLADFKPNITLGVFAIFIIFLLLIGSFTTGRVAMWSIISIGLFNSIMFPTIFSLGIKNLGLKTYQASSLLIMGIVGGAFIPPLQEILSESIGIQLSYLLPIVCYTYISYYGFKGSKIKIVETENADI